MVGYGGSSAGSYLADPTSAIPSHCASIVTTSTVRVKYETPCVQTARLKTYIVFPVQQTLFLQPFVFIVYTDTVMFIGEIRLDLSIACANAITVNSYKQSASHDN